MSGSPYAAPIRVAVLAGGYGTRLAEQTDAMPKPMVQIGGYPILWHILRLYGSAGFDEFVIACGYRGSMIKRYFLDYREETPDITVDLQHGTVTRLPSATRAMEPWRVTLLDTGLETATGGRLRRLREHLGETFFLTYGDGLCDVDLLALLQFHQSHGRLATFTAVQRASPFGRPLLDGDRCVEFTEKPLDPDEWINGGFCVLDRQIIDRIGSDDVSLEAQILPQLAQEDQLRAYRHHGFWAPMDTLRDVRHLNDLWTTGRAPWRR